MKRSKLIRNIYFEVEDVTRQQIDDILEVAEEFGMLPPDSLPSAISLSEYATEFAVRCKKRYKWEEECS